jgi:hypothetical protein
MGIVASSRNLLEKVEKLTLIFEGGIGVEDEA